ncbi:MAG: DUF4097 family beta strand repeat protein [Clostridia bacterium]|nr:DUF4097 family beta strand repeat protein [Clostridia bacterium]
MKKGFIISAIVFVVAGAILFVVAFIASGCDFSKADTAKYETNTYIFSEDFDAIEIRSKEADIVFKQSEDGKLRVDCVEREKVRHEVSIENGALKIVAVDKRAWYDHLTLFSFKSQSVTVYLPSNRYEVLTIAASTGDVSVPDLFSFGEAEITVSTGDVAFGACADGRLKIETSTGDIGIDGVTANNIDLSVSTGRIDAKNVDCGETLSVKVSTGKTFLTNVICKTLYSSGSTGDVTLKNAVASESFNIERGTGDVRFENCDAVQITVVTSTGDVTGTLRTEKVFITKTSTGDIDVPDTVSGGRCEITTSTGDIKIYLTKQ